ncbi:MAG: hypothetical protein M3Q93_09195 [Gemmatimonadota bacterium]|nr:hypothetical protein [Gemmatimonadota bacterium]
MTVCARLSDRMPDVALGRSGWTVDEAAHLDACADCLAEWNILSTAARLGASLVVSPDPAIMAARIIERVVIERSRERARTRGWAGAGIAAAAAAVALAVWTGQGDRPSSVPAPTEPPAVSSPVAAAPGPARRPTDSSLAQARPNPQERWELPMPELDSLSVEELDSMLRALDEPLAQADVETVGSDEAGDDELESVLAGLEG